MAAFEVPVSDLSRQCAATFGHHAVPRYTEEAWRSNEEMKKVLPGNANLPS
jgi:hypothetical protein